MSRKPKSIAAKAALAAMGAGIDAASFFNGLAMAGIMQRKTYLSTTGGGEEKHYWVISDDWLHCGANKKSMHEFRTDPVFAPEAMPSLLISSCEALLRHARSLGAAVDDTDGAIGN